MQLVTTRSQARKWALQDADWAERGTSCLRRGTAARLIHRDGCVTVMNGPILGCTNETGNCGCMHAEAILFRQALQIPGPKQIITTLSPCTACANLLTQLLDLDKVFWLRLLRHDTRGLRILESAGIQHEQV